jgi:hypothetical protein
VSVAAIERTLEMRCSRCVLSDCTPKISFDADGVCSYCHTYQPFEYRGEEELIKVLEPFRSSGNEYDCIVGVSGGRDSAYVLLKLVKDYGMRVLAVNYENPFTVPLAKHNIENMVNTLGTDLIHYGDKRDRHRRAFLEALAAWTRKPSPALIPIMCIGCKFLWPELFRIAKDRGIKCIVSGVNPYEVMSFKRELVNISRDEERESAFFKYAYVFREIMANPAFFKPHLVLTMMRAYLFGAPYSLGMRLAYGRSITSIRLFDYLVWDETEIISRIREELGWESPPEIKSTWRFDCRVKFLADLAYAKTLKMTDREDFYAKIVREGRMTRDAAIAKLEDENTIYMDQIELLMRDAGIEDTSFLERL